jgi:RHS repeat-associated protein
VDLYSCNATTSQIWTVYDNGTVQHLGMCLDVVGKGTTNGTKVDLNACNGGSNQIWLPEPDGALVNPASGKCLDDPGSTTTDGTQLQLYTCNGFKAQVWNLPPNQVPRQLGYGYDTSGDMLSRTANGTTTTYSYDAAAELTEAVTGSTTVSYGYDADGRQTSAGPVTRGYNVLGQLTKLVSGGTTTTFGYDAFGNRATTSIGGTAARTNHWDPVNPLPMLASQTVSGGASTSYGYDPLGQPQSITTPAGTYYDLPGPLGTVTDLTNAAGAEQVRDDYDPYGVTTQTSTAVGAPADPLGYDGQYGDPATGDYDLRARDYDPAIAAFTTPDPAEAESGLAYAYAAGNPVTGMDPSGLFTVTPVPCFSFSAGFFLGGSAQLCPLVLGMDDRTGRITFGGTFTAGAGYQSPGVGGSVGYQVTDARSVNQLGGLFEYLGGQLGVGPNMGVTGFDGPCAQAPGGTVVGADFTAGFDAEPGAEFHSGVSNTWIANYFSIG